MLHRLPYCSNLSAQSPSFMKTEFSTQGYHLFVFRMGFQGCHLQLFIHPIKYCIYDGSFFWVLLSVPPSVIQFHSETLHHVGEKVTRKQWKTDCGCPQMSLSVIIQKAIRTAIRTVNTWRVIIHNHTLMHVIYSNYLHLAAIFSSPSSNLQL